MRILAILFASLLLSGTNFNGHNELRKFSSATSIDTIPKNAQKLINSYPDHVSGFANNHIILKDGSELLWNDGIKNKSPQQLLEHPDLKDMFGQKYSTGEVKAHPPVNFDPGRTRNEAFFL